MASDSSRDRGAMATIVKMVLRHRAVVLSLWAVVTVLGVLASFNISSLLSTSLSVPGTDSATADVILKHHFANNVEGSFTVIVPPTVGTWSAGSEQAAIVRAATSIPDAAVTQGRLLGGTYYATINTPWNLARAANDTSALRRALTRNGLPTAMVTGPPALQHDITPVLRRDLRMGEISALIAAGLLLVTLLGFSWMVVVPFFVAGATTMASVGLVYVLAHHFLMVLYVPNVVELVGLGLAIDYSLLMVHRYRFERRGSPGSREQNLLTTMMSAGRTIVLSGVAVSLGLSTLLLVPVPFIRSLGVAGLIVPVVSVLAALTLQPIILDVVGRREDDSTHFRGVLWQRRVSAGAWSRATRAIVARPWRFGLAALVLVGGLGAMATSIELTPGSLTAIPSNIASARAISFVAHRVGVGVLTPNEVVIDSGRAGGVDSAVFQNDELALAVKISRDHEMIFVALDHIAPFVDATHRYAEILALGRHQFGSSSERAFVIRLRDNYVATSPMPSGTRVYVGGAPAQGVDFLDRLYGSFWWLAGVALVASFLLLARYFRSTFLAGLAIVLDAISVASAYGIMTLVFRYGVGQSVLGTFRSAQIEGWVPIFVFAVLFGLSMDYEVFIVARMREARLSGLSLTDSIVEGLGQTGGVVSAAAVILVAALGGLVFGHVAGLQELGVGLAAGVIVDASLIRGVILPSVMVIAHRAGWQWSKLATAPESLDGDPGAATVAT